MKRSRENSFMLISASLTLAFVVTVLPLPGWLHDCRPNFVVLILLYWLIQLPEAVGMFGAWLTGLVYDGVIGSPLGLHALGFSVLAAVMLMLYVRWRLLTVLQQLILIFVLLLVEKLISAWGQGLFYWSELSFSLFVSALIGVLFWLLLIFIVLRTSKAIQV